MRTKLTWLMTPLLVLFMSFSYGQEKTITGNVTDHNGLPLPGVSIVVVGTTSGTQTGFDGEYTIKVNVGQTLRYSYVGQKTTNRQVGSASTIDVQMDEDAEALEEVVVTGYATFAKKKSDVASVQISSETIENRPNGNIAQTLSGQVAGLDISTNSGQPGANSTIELRGASSINGNTEPLFLMDGIPVNEDNFRSLNPNEIESVTVLKDAGATAIYGNRGANGVVIIKTKRGKKGAGLQINYTGIISYSSLQIDNKKGYNLFESSQDYLRYERETGFGRGAGGGLGPVFPGTGVPMTDAEIAASPTTDWLKFFLRTGLTQNHTLSFSNGSENSSSYTSLGYFNQDGILKDSNLQRFNLRNNMGGSTKNGKFNYTSSLSVNYSKDNEPTSVGTSGVNQNPLFGAYSSLPYLTPEDYPGGRVLAQSFIIGYAPFYIIDKLTTSVALEEELKVIAGLSGTYRLSDNLTAGYTAGVDYQDITFLDSQHPISRNQLRFNTAVDGTQSQSSRRELAFNNTLSLTYNKEFGKHSLTTAAYMEYFKAHLRTFGFRQNGLNPKTFSPGDGDGFLPFDGTNNSLVDTVFANKLDAGLFSYFGTLNYDFDAKYGVSGTIRRDASYRFSSTNKWGTFWSAAGFWNIADEEFMSNTAFNTLKLRGSYGVTGNQRITGNSYWSGADLPLTLFTTGQGYGNNASIERGQTGNTTLKWETVNQYNIGLDFGLFENRLRGSIDVYEKKTEDLFQSNPLSATTGQTQINANVGSLYNRGFDWDLHYNVIQDTDFRLTLNFVGNYNKSELQDIPSEEGFINGIGRNGGILGERFLVRYAGINPANGNLLYLTKDGDVTESPNLDTDRVWTGENNRPEYAGSFGFEADYKGFYLTTQFNYETGISRFDFDYANAIDRDDIGDFNLSKDILRAWTPDNRVTDIPSLDATNLGTDDSFTDRFIRDLDYVRLRFVSLGYSVPKKYLENTGFSTVKFFGNAENVLTFTKFRGFDPSSRSGSRGFPTPKVFSFGVEVGF